MQLEKNRCLYLIHHDSIAIHSLSVQQLLNGQLAGLLTTLDIFTGIGNATNTSIGVESGRVYIGSHKVVSKGYIHAENSKMAHIGAIISSTHHTKHYIYWQIHQPVAWWITASHGRRRHLKTTQVLMDIWQGSKTSFSKAAWSTFSTNTCVWIVI